MLPNRKKKKGDIKKKSLQMFKSGKSIQEIANERELKENTIFGHLANFVDYREVKVANLIPAEHYEELKSIIPKYNFETLSDLKH